jgi:DhnA family fructose-bisphosphate aldolase class Ia
MPLPRLKRLFGDDQRCVILAFDHGLFGEPSWLVGAEDLPALIADCAAQGPDGMSLPTGSAGLLGELPGRPPALILRADVTNGYLDDRPARMHGYGLARAVERAVRLDAACVVAALLTFPGQEDLQRDCFATIDALRAACDDVAMPLMVELLAMTDNDGVPKVSDDPATIAPLVRQAFELGADVIKADPTGPPERFDEVIAAAAGVPVLASGGVPAADDEIVRRTAALMAAGASGIAYGRNVLWAQDRRAMTRALIEVVHGGRSAQDAMQATGMAVPAGVAA